MDNHQFEINKKNLTRAPEERIRQKVLLPLALAILFLLVGGTGFGRRLEEFKGLAGG